jgi:hypothetical protein
MYPIVLTTAGAYSDYRVLGIFEWISSTKPSEALAIFTDENPECTKDYHFDEDQFAGWLHERGYVRDLEHHEMHLGEYGRVETAQMPDISATPAEEVAA